MNDIGSQIGNFLGGMFNPIIGGTTTTTTTEPTKAKSSNTVLYLVIGGLIILTIGYFITRSKQATA